MTPAASLFDAGADSPIGAAANWLVALLSGSLATMLCVIAVALLGMMMLWGRISLRRGMQVVLGCFLLLGASRIASELHVIGGDLASANPEPVIITPPAASPSPLPPANYDPYAGASLLRR